MSKYQLIALDMDGTLLNSQKQISKSTLQAIQKASEAGKEVVLSTGRCIAELKEYLDILPQVRYLVCVSGAMVYDLQTEQVIYSKRIPEATVHSLLAEGRREDAAIQALTKEAVMEANKIPRMNLYRMEQYIPLYERSVTKVEDIVAYYEEHPAELEKMNLYYFSPEQRRRSRERLQPLGLEMVETEYGVLECSVAGMSKRVGMEKLCEYIQIPVENVIAVGDSDNDVELLKYVGLPVAMGNANEHVKQVCKVMVSDCDHDGCAEAIYRYLLNEEE